MKLTPLQTEAILWAMFGIENEIEHLKYLLIGTPDQDQTFLKGQLKLRQSHYVAMKELFEKSKGDQDK